MPPLADDDAFRFAGKRGAEARREFDAAAQRLQRAPDPLCVLPSVSPENGGIPTESMSPLKRWFLGQLARKA